MYCENIEECFEQISAYFDGNKTGHFLIVNSDNYDVYQGILQRLQADSSKKCYYVSDNCFPNGLPDVNSLLEKAMSEDTYAVIGLSQALMLNGNRNLEAKIDEVLGQSISGHGIVLLDHCSQLLKKFAHCDKRIKNRIILVDGELSQLPQIKLASCESECIGVQPLNSISSLLAYLECLTEAQSKQKPCITVISSFPPKMFEYAVYSIKPVKDIYEALVEEYTDIAGATQKEYGTDLQWNWLARKMTAHNSLSSLICTCFGATVNLSAHISDIMGEDSSNYQWLLWLAMKAFEEKNNKYLTIVLNNSQRYDDFEIHLYLDLAEIDANNPNFTILYSERKRLIGLFPENYLLIAKYCERIGIHQKEEIFYLTDCSDMEKYEFVRCLSVYDYTEEEIDRAVQSMSKALSLYMQKFTFDSVNTKLSKSDEAFREKLTSYFKAYKMQKLTNRIYPEFLDIVNDYAISRPYNKLRPRSSIISHMDKNNMQLFFFDALGVEYLAFILAKCEEYGLSSEISIGHCELPSITINNKEFMQCFPTTDCRKISNLDEIKHHSQVYNYQKCEYPLHLFEELDIIDEELRRIHSMLVQGTLEQALIVSDHGASRLAVRYGHESDSDIKLKESGEHSGRCCLVNEDPNIAFAAYEGGFSVLANYERFKGGRRANVEVHGGASLEEVLVPIIVLRKLPENVEACFTNSVIILEPRVVPELILYSNIALQHPRLCIDGEYYDGVFITDKKHARFSVPKIKRKGNYSCEVFDGDKNMSITLEFIVQRQTREVDLF